MSCQRRSIQYMSFSELGTPTSQKPTGDATNFGTRYVFTFRKPSANWSRQVIVSGESVKNLSYDLNS